MRQGLRVHGRDQVLELSLHAGLVIWTTDKSATQPRWGPLIAPEYEPRA